MTYMDVEQQINRRRENMINKKGGRALPGAGEKAAAAAGAGSSGVGEPGRGPPGAVGPGGGAGRAWEKGARERRETERFCER
jgi:hypothetical protein